MAVYVHNGASQYKNDNGNGPSVAHNTKVKVALPGGEASTFNPTASISASNAATVSDGLTINCNGKKVKLQYITGSASQWSEKTGVVGLSDSIVTTGASIRSDKKAGDVWGCWTDRVYVILAAKVVDVPVKPPVVDAMCKLFEVTAKASREVTVSSFQNTITNATFTKVVINWGDGSNTTVTDLSKVVGTTHKYAKDGNYKITTTVTYTSNVDGKTITSTSTNCQTEVSFVPNEPPKVTPPKVTPPAELPKTGVGSIAGIFAAVSAFSAVAYRWVISRRLSANS